MNASRIKLRVAPDGLRVLADVVSGAAEGIAQLKAALTAARVVYAHDSSGLAELAAKLRDPSFRATDFVVARGLEPVLGRDGYFEPAFPSGIEPARVAADGAFEFCDRELLQPVAEGDFVGVLHPPVPSVAGRRVDGGELEVPAVQASKLQLGPGVRIDDQGRVQAALAGAVLYRPEQMLDVIAQHVHDGNIDVHSGGLDVEGALVVHGTVERLCSVHASGDLEIDGGIENGSAHSGESLRIRGGVRGDSGLVSAERDVSAHHAEAARVVCGGLLKLETALNSELSAHMIQIVQTIRGGSAQAEVGLVVQQAGAPNGSVTRLAAGVPLELPAREVRRAIFAAKEQRALQHRGGGREGGERGKSGKPGRAQASLASEEIERKTRLAERRAQLTAEAYVQIRGRAYPGVLIQIGLQSFTVENEISNARYSFDAMTRQIRKQEAR